MMSDTLLDHEPSTNAVETLVLPTGEAFYPALAKALLAHAPAQQGHDLSALQIILPSWPIAIPIRAALYDEAASALLLPHFNTLHAWVSAQEVPEAATLLPNSERQVMLYEALRQQGWFDESALWGIVSEMSSVFDELTAASLSLPADADNLRQQLEHAYALRASSALAFEAQVIHETWRIMTRSGRLDTAQLYRRRLAALSTQTQTTYHATFIVLSDAPQHAQNSAENACFAHYATRHRLYYAYPTGRAHKTTALQQVLASAWPREDNAAPLSERAHELTRHMPHSPLATRLQLVPTKGREQEARAVVAQVGAWLQQGYRHIALIAADRLSARRVRALLERDDILVNDESGWLLSTSRAAATVDALLEIVSSQGYHRDFLDLLKAPFIFAEENEETRRDAIFLLEKLLRKHSLKADLATLSRLIEAHIAAEPKAPAHALLARNLLNGLAAAMNLLHGRVAPLARWLERLEKALTALGALKALQQDDAGAVLLTHLHMRRDELYNTPAPFSRKVWRDWLNRELESVRFRDRTIKSPITLCSLEAAQLRPFEAALLIGGDTEHLSTQVRSQFFNHAVRHELGLPAQAQVEEAQRSALERLIYFVPQLIITWQAERDGEANLLAPDLDRLASLHQLAWQDNLHRQTLPARAEASVDTLSAPTISQSAAPAAPKDLLPSRISVSAYANLIECPYRFFARYILRLNEVDEVAEEMQKSDYGQQIHAILEKFHRQHPQLLALSRENALRALTQISEEAFAPALREDFLANAWRLRWQKHLPAYIDWQTRREAEGWRWRQAETTVSAQLILNEGQYIEVYGRIDREDHHAEGEHVALLDYKTQTVSAIKTRLADDVQLPLYAFLRVNTHNALPNTVSEAIYVALDDETVESLSSSNTAADLAEDAAQQADRLRTLFSALHQESPLPANGSNKTCQWCEMEGLCRKTHWDKEAT